MQALAIGGNQLGFELVTARCLQKCADVPVFLGNETFDLGFTIADETQCNGLHAAGRASAGQLAPQHRRQIEADEIIERAAGEIGVDQWNVDVAWVRHRIQHRLFGDGVEDHTLHRLVAENALLLQKIEHMPGNRFALAIRVGCEKQAVGGFHRVGNVLHALGGRAIDLPGHFEVLVGQHRSVLGRKVPDVAKRCKNLVAGTKILVDRLGFGRRFYDDDIHIFFSGNWSVNIAGLQPNAATRPLYNSTWTGNARGSRGKADFIAPRRAQPMDNLSLYCNLW